jgi:hypothetical protein
MAYRAAANLCRPTSLAVLFELNVALAREMHSLVAFFIDDCPYRMKSFWRSAFIAHTGAAMMAFDLLH